MSRKLRQEHFDRKFLQLISFLARNQKILTPEEISQRFEIDGKKTSSRTIRRWFARLQKISDYFDYYPVPMYEKFGLVYGHVFINGLKNLDLIKIIPYNTFFLCGTQLEKLRNQTLVAYLVPEERLKEFENFWQTAQKMNLLESFKIFHAHDTVYFYSKLHETFHKGVSNFAAEDDDYFPEILQTAMRRKKLVGLDDKIKKNPLILAVILEYFREHWSSPKVWQSAKEKLGDNIWDYIKDIKIRLKRDDNAGIKLVQEITSHANSNFDAFFRQIKIDYAPLWSHKNNLFAYFTVNLEKDKLLDFMKTLHKNSLQCGVYLPCEDNNAHLFYTLTDFSGFNRIINELNAFPAAGKSVMVADHEATKKYWTRDFMKFDYSKVFDPKNCKWIYEHDKYLKDLEKLKNNAP